MAKQILLPLLGDIMKAGTIARWLKLDGELIVAGDPLYVVETHKISFEVQSTESGRLHRVADEGATVRVGGTVGWLLEEGEAAPPAKVASSGASATSSMPLPDRTAPRASPRATHAARHLAREHYISLEGVHGTGPGGRIMESDVVRSVKAHRRPSGATGSPGTTKVIPLRGKRGVVAQRMLKSLRSMAQLTITLEVEMAGTARLREDLAQAGLRVSHNDIIVKAAAMALKEHPLLNSTVRGGEIHLLDEINVGLAVHTSDGLMVPVVRNADQKSLREIAATTSELVERTRAGRLTLDDVAHGTFTVSAMGMYGVDIFTPIVNPPQVAILGVGRLNKRLALVEREVCEVATLYLSLSFDHRAVDGVPAAKFLRTIKSYLENPARFGPQT